MYDDEDKACWDWDSQSKLDRAQAAQKGCIDRIKVSFKGGDKGNKLNGLAKERGQDLEIPRGAAVKGAAAIPARPEPKECEEKIDGKVGLMKTKAAHLDEIQREQMNAVLLGHGMLKAFLFWH